jgi:hypothetical protein
MECPSIVPCEKREVTARTRPPLVYPWRRYGVLEMCQSTVNHFPSTLSHVVLDRVATLVVLPLRSTQVLTLLTG